MSTIATTSLISADNIRLAFELLTVEDLPKDFRDCSRMADGLYATYLNNCKTIAHVVGGKLTYVYVGGNDNTYGDSNVSQDDNRVYGSCIELQRAVSTLLQSTAAADAA